MERPLRIGSRDLNAEKTHMCTFEGRALQVADGAKGSRSASGLVWVGGGGGRDCGALMRGQGLSSVTAVPVGQATQIEERAQETCFHAKVQ